MDNKHKQKQNIYVNIYIYIYRLEYIHKKINSNYRKSSEIGGVEGKLEAQKWTS